MKSRDDGVTRRRFIGTVGSSCAVLGMAGLSAGDSQARQRQGAPPGPRQRTSAKTVSEGKTIRVSTDVLVVGGGMAGVFAAVKAHDNGAKVMLVDKGSVGKSGQTPFARGIFRFDEEQIGMSRAEYLERTAEASEQMNNPTYTALLLDHSAERIGELDSWGFFDSAAYAKSLRRPLEERQIPLYERVMLTHLLKEDGRIAGAMGLYLDKNETLVILARSVILCTGASGFKPPGWQIGSLTSDGDAMAYRIGAEITGKEWCDGHSRTNPGLEGLNQVVSQANLVPMLGVEQNVAVSQNGPITTMGPPPGDRPDGAADGKGPMGPPPGGGAPDGGPSGGPPPGGGDPPVTMGGASAGMSIHKAEGLFPADGECASNIPGLYAAGDSLGSMQTGGIYTQVGSSLAGSAVQGAVAGEAAARYAETIFHAGMSQKTLARVNSEIYAPLLRERGFSPGWVTQALQGIMIPNFILYVKSEERLQAALTYVEYLRNHHIPLLMADDEHELRQAHETANMVLNAEMKLRASLMRTESRGSHYREDHPERNDDEWTAWIKIRLSDDGTMQLIKHPIERS
ncbi:MAG: FAD-binding protein [Acidobacteriota bacterium]|nr:FAD-binding protein [Acidobacteriota bacterium]